MRTAVDDDAWPLGCKNGSGYVLRQHARRKEPWHAEHPGDLDPPDHRHSQMLGERYGKRPECLQVVIALIVSRKDFRSPMKAEKCRLPDTDRLLWGTAVLTGSLD